MQQALETIAIVFVSLGAVFLMAGSLIVAEVATPESSRYDRFVARVLAGRGWAERGLTGWRFVRALAITVIVVTAFLAAAAALIAA